MFVVGGAIILMVVVGSVQTFIHGKYTTADWFNLLVFGLALGGVYALIALNLPWSTACCAINFAHSGSCGRTIHGLFRRDALSRSGFLDQVDRLIVGLIIIFLVAMAISTLVAVGSNGSPIGRCAPAPRLVPLITAIGASFFLRVLLPRLYGPTSMPIRTSPPQARNSNRRFPYNTFNCWSLRRPSS
jgi:branched-chain amino acid transport system permease protein